MIVLALTLAYAQVPSCIAAGTRASGSEQLRPVSVFRCSYTGEEATQRVTRLLALRRSQVSEREIRRILSLPALPTNFDDPYVASYTAVLEGGGWGVNLDYKESFFPRSGPARFSGSAYPRRQTRKRGNWQLGIMPIRDRLSDASPQSFSAYELARAAKKFRWKLRRPQGALDSGVVTPTYERGDRETLMIFGVRSSGLAPTDDEMRAECSWNLNVDWDDK